ncbi:MAG: hypothetical protein ABI629_19905, partial [bacterium]
FTSARDMPKRSAPKPVGSATLAAQAMVAANNPAARPAPNRTARRSRGAAHAAAARRTNENGRARVSSMNRLPVMNALSCESNRAKP